MKATQQDTIIFKSADLQNAAQSLRFELPQLGEFVSGFIIRFHDKPYAYINQCAHVPVELDWNQGEFFTAQKDYIICATHGALYQPETGLCVMGPCKGKQLKPIEVIEQNQEIIINLSSATK